MYKYTLPATLTHIPIGNTALIAALAAQMPQSHPSNNVANKQIACCCAHRRDPHFIRRARAFTPLVHNSARVCTQTCIHTPHSYRHTHTNISYILLYTYANCEKRARPADGKTPRMPNGCPVLRSKTFIIV